MLALLGWWWFFLRKKQVSSSEEQAESGAVALRAGPATVELLPMEEACPTVVFMPPSVIQLTGQDESTASEPSMEPPALLQTNLPHRRAESSGSLPDSTDSRSQANSPKVELAVMGDEARSVPLACPLTFPHETVQVYKREPALGRVPATEKHGPGEKARDREMGGAEGTGDAVLGGEVLDEGLLPQECVLELENNKALGPPLVVGAVGALSKGECAVWKSLSGVVEPAPAELAREEETPAPQITGGKARDKDLVERGKEEALDDNKKIEQAASQIISQVILKATEEVLATTVGKTAELVDQAAAVQPQGQQEEKNCAPVSQETVSGQDGVEPTPATAGEAASPLSAALPSPGPLAGDLPPPKTYVSCLSSPLSSPTKDRKPKNSAHPISLAPCLPPDTPLREPLDEASTPVEDATCVTCMSDSQNVPSVASSGQCSDSVSTSELEDCCTETNSSPRDKAIITPQLPDSTEAFSNGLLKGELSDVGTEDGWSVDAEADHSGDTPLREPLDEASTPVEDATCVTCMSDSQNVPSVASSGQCSAVVSTSELEDCCTETNSSPRDKAIITPQLDSTTEAFSNGLLKGELSDVGTEDGWSVDAEADHSGGSDGNSMDSESCGGGGRKTDSLSTQAGSDPKKVDLIVWEIEVPKHLVGRLIGKQGRYVSFLKQTSGAKIYISTLPYTQNIQICHIEGSQHHVDKALNLIGKKFKELNLTNIYAPPLPSLALPSLPMTSWLMLPDGITVEVIVVSQVNAGHLFVQQHTHPTFHALRSLDQQMYLCYSQPGIPTLPTPVEITVICAAPGLDGAWWRAQVVASYEETNEVEIRYVDYGGYKRVKVDVLRQIRSDFVTLPFQGAEVLLDSVMPLSDDDRFSPEADAAMSEMTGNTALLAQVTSYSPTGLPLIQLWSVVGDEVVLINRSLVERGLAQWVDSYYSSL
ncbi:A kinase anchor protein 1, mitochondrial [Heterocephalus glaber]|uniref:A-kinase anchor protein 1, mitochondrial n=1 Tax=Heterocephalus glaber TaxID=10181 RepID=G5C5I7_HETGA|nr:A kinase anchor protein 1, mitochondrial [Heterocephalus glaber]